MGFSLYHAYYNIIQSYTLTYMPYIPNVIRKIVVTHLLIITKILSLFLSLLTWPSCISSMLNIGGWSSLPGTEASVALGTVLSGLCATLYLPPARSPSKNMWFFRHIIPSPSSTPNLISLSLRLQFYPPPPLCCCIPLPYPQDIHGGLLLPLPG